MPRTGKGLAEVLGCGADRASVGDEGADCRARVSPDGAVPGLSGGVWNGSSDSTEVRDGFSGDASMIENSDLALSVAFGGSSRNGVIPTSC